MLFLWYFSFCSSCNFFEGIDFCSRENHSQIVKIFCYSRDAPHHLEGFLGVSTSPPSQLRTCHALGSSSATRPAQERGVQGTWLGRVNGDGSSATGWKIFSSGDEQIQSRELKVLFSHQKSGEHGGMKSPDENGAVGTFQQGKTAQDLFYFLSAEQRLEHFSSGKCSQQVFQLGLRIHRESGRESSWLCKDSSELCLDPRKGHLHLVHSLGFGQKGERSLGYSVRWQKGSYFHFLKNSWKYFFTLFHKFLWYFSGITQKTLSAQAVPIQKSQQTDGWRRQGVVPCLLTEFSQPSLRTHF